MTNRVLRSFLAMDTPERNAPSRMAELVFPAGRIIHATSNGFLRTKKRFGRSAQGCCITILGYLTTQPNVCKAKKMCRRTSI